MKVHVEDVSSVKKILHIEIPQDEVAAELDSAYRNLKKNAKIKGFRPGKAPRSVIERLYKKEVEADISSRLIQSSFSDALKETDLNIVSRPTIDPPKLDASSAYKYDATVEVKPVLEDIDIKGIALKRTDYKAGEDEIDAQLKLLRQNMAKRIKIDEDRPVKEGDFVVIDYEGKRDGKPYKETAKTENFTLKVGEGHITKDFDDNLVGKKPGESIEFDIKFPEDHFNEELKNLTITFHVTIREIRKEELPELDDEFAKSLGQFETLEDLKNVIKENLNEGYEKRIEQELNEQIFKNLISKTEFEVPESLVAYELENIIADTEKRLSYQNRSLEEAGLDRDKLREQYRETAENQVRRQIILSKVIEQEALELTDEELEKGYEDMARSFNQPVEQIKAFYDQNKERLGFFKHALLEKKAIRLIISNGKIENVEPQKSSGKEAEAVSETESTDSSVKSGESSKAESELAETGGSKDS